MGARGLRTRVDTTVAAVAGITVIGFAFRLAVLLRPIGVVDKLFIPDDTYYTLTSRARSRTVTGRRSTATR